MNKYSNIVKPLGIVITSGLSFLLSLVAFIITGVKSTYDDGYGVSYMYGRKDLLVITLSSLILLILGIILLVNCLRKRKTEPWVSPFFILVAVALFSLFALGEILDPILNGKVEWNVNYIFNLIATVFGLVGLIISIIVLINFLTKKHALLNIVFIRLSTALCCVSILIYCLNQGIGLLSSDLVIGIFFISIGIMNLLELIPLTYFRRLKI